MKLSPVYKTDIEESEAVLVPHVGDGSLSPTPDPKSAFKDEVLASEVLESALVEDVPETLTGARSISPTKETSKIISPGHSVGAIHLFGDGDELSEISDFDPENDVVNERVPTGVSTSRDHKLKPTRHKIDRIPMNGSPSATSAMGIEKSSEFAVKIGGRTERVPQRSPENGKPLLTSISPVSGSPSTQIDVSPKPLSSADTLLTTVGIEVVGGLSVASQDFVCTDRLKKSRVNECKPSNTEPIIASAGKPQTGFSSTEGELGQDARQLTSSSGVIQKVHSVNEITKYTGVPPKIAGSRRKRETVKSSGKGIIEDDNESMPPRKKSRDERLGIRVDKAKPNETSLDAISIPRAKIYTTPAKGSSPSTDPTMVDFDELPELKSTRQGTRRSSRIKKKQTAATAGTRANAVRGKTQKANQANGQSAYGTERKKLTAFSLQDPSVRISHDTPLIFGSHPEPTLIRESPSPKFNSDVVSNATFVIVELEVR